MSKTEMLTIKESAVRLGLGLTSAYKLLKNEPGVHRIFMPGSKKPVIRVEPAVIERILRRTAIPA